MNVLFIRGLTRESRHWHGLVERFQKDNPKILVHSIDLPGVGIYNKLLSPANLDEYVFFLKEKLGPKNTPLICIGMSLGGMIALRWAQIFPADIKKAFVINCSASNLSSIKERFNLSEYKKILGIILTDDPFLKEERILKLTTEKVFSNNELSKEIIEEFGAIQKSNPVGLRSALNQIWAASNFTLTEDLKTPVVIICGEKDRLVSPNCSRALAESLEMPIYTHPEAGHDLALDDPNWLLSIININMSFTVEP